MTVAEIFLLYVCPSLGGIMSTTMFAAPVNDLRNALTAGSLGDLNPFPFAMMAGNTLGWVIYGYLVHDPFLVASNLPGFILSIWLNVGAIKLEYLHQRMQRWDAERTVEGTHHNRLLAVMQRWDADRIVEDDDDNGGSGGMLTRRRQQQQGNPQHPSAEDAAILLPQSAEEQAELTMTHQETLLLRVLVFWSAILTYTSWLYPYKSDPANLVGILVNINLVVFYAAPLKTIRKVVSERNSASIHYESMVMNWINTSFWILYGLARHDLVIVLPNATGLSLGLAQGVLCILYPRQSQNGGAARLSLHEIESDLIQHQQQPLNPEETIPSSGDDDKSQASARPPELV